MSTAAPANSTTPVIYLRCFPQDTWAMQPHLRVLQDYAHRLDLPEPTVHFDNGHPSGGACPELRLLLERAKAGLIRDVLVPGLWVFSIHDQQAEHTRSLLVSHGCTVRQPPSTHSAPG